MSKGDFLENAILNHVIGRSSTYTPPATLDLALYTVAPTDVGTSGTEVSSSGTAYARKNVPNDSATWGGDTSTGSKSNAVAIRFAEATASWGTVVAFALFAPGTNNMLYRGAVTPNKAIGSGITPEFGVGTLTITED